jgi:hypothetical protein
MNKENKESLQEDLLLLIGYLLTSAHGLYEEPAGYGPFRLLDTTGRLLEIMRRHELSSPYLEELAGAIESERFGNSDDEALRTTLNTLCVRYAAELRKRYPLQEKKA